MRDDAHFQTLQRSKPFSYLKVLECGYNLACYLLSGCPNLVALCVNSGSGDALLTSIAASCPLLQRLELVEVHGLSVHAMLAIAHACPLIQHLGFKWCDGPVELCLDEVVVAMLNLHTLSVSYVLEWILLEIAIRGHPTLRTLHTADFGRSRLQCHN